MRQQVQSTGAQASETGGPDLSDLKDAHTRLVVYGTLAPGEVNHHQMHGLTGTWTRGRIRGRFDRHGWGAPHGCPGFIPDADGAVFDVHLFTSPDLPDHWDRLDAFEGADYRRTIITARTDDGPRAAFIYAFTAYPAGRGGKA